MKRPPRRTTTIQATPPSSTGPPPSERDEVRLIADLADVFVAGEMHRYHRGVKDLESELRRKRSELKKVREFVDFWGE